MNLFAQQFQDQAAQQSMPQAPIPQAPVPPMGVGGIPPQAPVQQVPVYGGNSGQHPGIQLNIPQVQTPPHTPNAQFGMRSPEAAAQEAYQNHQQQGIVPSQPQVNFTPTNQGQMPQSQVNHMPQHQMQQQQADSIRGYS